MNSFLDLHTDIDYQNTNRAYYTGTWEYINIASDYFIPFQWEGVSTEIFNIYKVDIDGNETNITNAFYDTSASKVTGWTETTTGTWSITGPLFSATSADANDYITSNTFSLTEGRTLSIDFDSPANCSPSATWTFYIKKGGVTKYTKTSFAGWDGSFLFEAPETGSDYTIVIEISSGGSATLSVVTAYQSYINQSGNYFWYNGFQLASLYTTDVCYLKIVHDSTYYSDWLDPCGLTGKLKYKVSSEFDYGGIKYEDGYEQWIYKNASVRRSPRAEIEQIGDQRNGVLILEKSVSAVRYVMKMKCTEAEYEAFVHSIGGTVEITDQTGKVYDATILEISDPSWHRSNGIVEISFTDQNNVNVWTKNNSTL